MEVVNDVAGDGSPWERSLVCATDVLMELCGRSSTNFARLIIAHGMGRAETYVIIAMGELTASLPWTGSHKWQAAMKKRIKLLIMQSE
jgi:hypothetical protein